MMNSKDISVETPLIYSQPLSVVAERDVYLKLECCQPTGSFKLRGIASSCVEKAREGCKKFVGSSGGNAGLALAYAAQKLNIPCQLYVPEYVPQRMLERFKAYDVNVTIGGKIWHEANSKALEECAADPTIGYIHPYDDPDLWEAYADIVVSVKHQLKGKKPSCFVVSVGGGGLLCGILRGIDIVGWKDVPVVAMETVGADCFNLSVKAGKIIEKPPTSIAKTLGANSVAPILMEWLEEYNIISHVLPDKEAVRGCVRFADDHGILVEPSCGVSLATVYAKVLPNLLEENGFNSSRGPIVIVVCGGSDMTPSILMDLASQFDVVNE